MTVEKSTHTIEKAIEKVKKNSREKFDATVEAHINLSIDKSQNIRFTTTLPNGTGIKQKVAVMAATKVDNADLNLSEEDLIKIEKGDLKPNDDFDVLIAEPMYMSKIAKVARILGPAGVMPNPKAGTVTDNVAEAVEQIKKGKIEIRTEKDSPIIHTIIGKVSFSKEELIENLQELLKVLKQNKPGKAKPNWIKNIYVKSSMGNPYKIEVETEQTQ